MSASELFVQPLPTPVAVLGRRWWRWLPAGKHKSYSAWHLWAEDRLPCRASAAVCGTRPPAQVAMLDAVRDGQARPHGRVCAACERNSR